jgi:hypothetical protein
MISRKSSIDAILNWKSKSKKWRLNIAAKMIVDNLKIKKFKQKEVFNGPNFSGSTNDSLAWPMTALAEAITSGLLPHQYFIIGDEAFSCTEQMLSPYSGRGLGKYKDSFNSWLSHSRQAIESAFGMQGMRWTAIWNATTAVEPLLGRSNRRQLITENLERLGKGRPPHAVCNSRTDRWKVSINHSINQSINNNYNNNINNDNNNNIAGNLIIIMSLLKLSI